MNWKSIDQSETNNIRKRLDNIEEILKEKSINLRNPGLMGGKFGIALYFLYYAKLVDKQEPYDHGLELLSSVFEDVNNGFNYHTHAGGLAGIGVVMEILNNADLVDSDTNELLCGLDEYLYKRMIHDIKEGDYDFLHGAVGLAFYFLKRLSGENSGKYLEEFLEELDKIAIKDEQGIRWISELDKEKRAKGFNLSLSHGLASIIAFLSKLYSINIAKEKVFELLKGAVKYLLNQQQDVSKYDSNFPSWICETEPSKYSRMAWCYGDLGIGIALWLAGNNTNNEAWKAKAVEVLLQTTKRRSVEETGVVDAGLCHGAAGIAHIYNRMYNYTNIKDFKESAIYWFNKTIEMAFHKDTLSGYKVHRVEKHGGPYENFAFLEGIAGIGLAFISAISDTEPAWDEVLLLS